jgi:hypothetical protein
MVADAPPKRVFRPETSASKPCWGNRAVDHGLHGGWVAFALHGEAAGRRGQLGDVVRVRSSAATPSYSSTPPRRRLPGIGTIQGFRASSQASASTAGSTRLRAKRRVVMRSTLYMRIIGRVSDHTSDRISVGQPLASEGDGKSAPVPRRSDSVGGFLPTG